MPFAFEKTPIEGLLIARPKVFEDERGFFMEAFSRKDFSSAGIDIEIVQINHSRSTRGVIRGLHFQRPPHQQAKLVRCVKGAVLDVAVDIRPSSETFGKHFRLELSESNKALLFVPRGFAHGFLILSEVAEVEYAVDSAYSPEHEGGIIWNDPTLAIQWPVSNPVLSERDRRWPKLGEIKDSLSQGERESERHA